MKLFNSYSHTFSNGLTFSGELWDLIKDDPSCNGLYLAHPDYIDVGKDTTTNIVRTWYNSLYDGNYLYTANNNAVFIPSDSQFNNYPSINFSDSLNTQLLFKFPISVATLLIVYLTRVNGSYIIYAPRALPDPGGSPLIYDAFPSGGSTLWSTETLTNSSVYNAKSRINGKLVASNIFVPLNVARVLSVREIASVDGKESISGIGGKAGAIGGTTSGSLSATVRGKVAAIITFSDTITLSKQQALETILGKYYIQYNGIVLSSTPVFKYLLGTAFSFDFSTIVLDEWFDIFSYELIAPLDYGLVFTGSVLAGTLSTVIDSKLKIRVTNTNSVTKDFEFTFIVIKSDPIISFLPQTNDIKLVLSADTDGSNNYYGLKTTGSNEIVEWEDARRITYLTPSRPKLTVVGNNNPLYIPSNINFNNKGTAKFSATSELVLNAGLSAKTFVWVYRQTETGVRNLLDSFPDIKGTGELWTVAIANQIHGQTTITKLVTKVQRVQVNTLNYKLKQNETCIIIATQPEDSSISFNGFKKLKGELAFFICWDRVLNSGEINTVTNLLARRYANSLYPYIFDSSTEFRTDYSINLDLSTKVVSLDSDYLPLTYTVVSGHPSSTIGADTLYLTATTDETILYEIDVTNNLNLTTRLTFYIDVSVRTNSLYISLKNLLGLSVRSVFIPNEADTLIYSGSTISELKDYRLNSTKLLGDSVTTESLALLNNRVALNFSFGGSSFLSFNSSQSGKCFVCIYVRKENTVNKAFLFGQSLSQEFSSGNAGVLFDTSTSSDLTANVNGYTVPSSYYLQSNVINVVVINSSTTKTIDSIAKDRVFTDRSVKGYLSFIMVLDRTLTSEESLSLNKICRDYFQPAKFICILHMDGSVFDSSEFNKALSFTGSLSTTFKKFGANGYLLIVNSVSNYITIENNSDLAFQNEDFTISFWLQINKASTASEIIYLYSQTDLVIYIQNSDLVIGRNIFNPLITTTLAGGFFNAGAVFNHIQLGRAGRKLYLFINGVLITSVDDTNEYKDYTNPGRIGSSATLTTSAVNASIDEFIIYRRSCFNTTNFTVPTSAY